MRKLVILSLIGFSLGFLVQTANAFELPTISIKPGRESHSIISLINNPSQLCCSNEQVVNTYLETTPFQRMVRKLRIKYPTKETVPQGLVEIEQNGFESGFYEQLVSTWVNYSDIFGDHIALSNTIEVK